jgi:predicted small lipoprotein YifL
MRLNISLSIIVALALPLQGCGKKGPLMLPSPQAQTPSPQKPEPQAPVAPAPEQSKQP